MPLEPAQSADALEPTEAPALFDSTFLAKLEQLYLLSRKLFRGEQRADRPSRQTGASLEFADYRNYVRGDDLRSIDWNIYGRLDRLFVKLFEEEQDMHIYLLIDASASMTWHPEPGNVEAGISRLSKFDQARRIAAALAYIGLANLDRVNVTWFTDVVESEMGFARGKSQFHKVLEFLRRPPAASGETRLSPVFRSFAKRTRRRGMVIVFSDFFDSDGAEEALALLRYQRFEVFATQVLDPVEIDPAVAGDLRLVEPEGGRVLEITANDALVKRYKAEFGRAQDALSRFCRERGIGLVSTTTAIPFEDLVLRVLRSGALLR
jgi:uncharacterized protein (DUF58 family)